MIKASTRFYKCWHLKVAKHSNGFIGCDNTFLKLLPVRDDKKLALVILQEEAVFTRCFRFTQCNMEHTCLWYSTMVRDVTAEEESVSNGHTLCDKTPEEGSTVNNKISHLIQRNAS